MHRAIRGTTGINRVHVKVFSLLVVYIANVQVCTTRLVHSYKLENCPKLEIHCPKRVPCRVHLAAPVVLVVVEVVVAKKTTRCGSASCVPPQTRRQHGSIEEGILDLERDVQ